jgi:hypothetical protein
MKKIISTLAVLAFTGILIISCEEDDATPVNQEQSCLPDNLQNGLIASYTFAGGSLQDGTGSAHLTASSAQPAADRQGNLDCAYSFAGSGNSYLISQDTGFLNNLTTLSVSFWYQPQGNQVDYELLLGRGEGMHCPDSYGEWSVGLYDCRRAVFGHGNSVWDDMITDMSEGCAGEEDARTNVWHHVTVTCVKATNEIKIYHNGILQDSATGMADCGMGGTPTVDDIGNLMIGKYFSGKIDDIVIYNRVLTQAEISQLHQLAPCCE